MVVLNYKVSAYSSEGVMIKRSFLPFSCSFFPIAVFLSLVITACGDVRYDTTSHTFSSSKDEIARSNAVPASVHHYAVGPNDNATAKYSYYPNHGANVYTHYPDGTRYTIGQHDDATAHYSLNKGNRNSFINRTANSKGGPLSSDGSGNLKSSPPPSPMVLEITDVLFEFDKSVIKKIYYPELNKWVDFFLKNPQVNAKIFGHADSTGPLVYNQKLSERRAVAVINYLIDKGVTPNRLTSTGFGETVPIAPNTTREGRQKNRRVEMHY